MAILDFILNCAGLLLWLNWRSRGLASPGRASGIALISTLKRAGTAERDRWISPAALGAILFLRAIFYWQIGPAAHWTPRLPLGAIVLHFRADMFTRMMMFSLLGFLLVLAVFYFSLLLISAVNRPAGAAEPWSALARAHLGPLARLPAWLQLVLPFGIAFLFWIIIGPLLGVMRVQVAAASFGPLAGQAAVIGLGSWLLWQYLIAAVLVLHTVSSYVYFGNTPFWVFIGVTARNLLRPLAPLPLRIGKIDLLPLLALAAVVLVGLYAPRGLVWLYGRLAS